MYRYLITLMCSLFCFLSLNAQNIYSGYWRYDEPGGMFDKDILRTINLTFYESNYHDILVDGWFDNDGLRLPAIMEMDGTTLDSVAVRNKGNSTFYIFWSQGNPKLPYNIDMNDIIGGQNILGYKKLKLANAGFDPSFAKEVTAYDIYKKYLPSPEANHLKLNVQGEYLGCYVNTESINKQFLNKHFDENDGTLFKCDPSGQFGVSTSTLLPTLEWLGSDTTLYVEGYDLKSDAGWADLVNFIDLLNNDPANVHTVLNVDRVLWYLAVNMILPNTDTYNLLVHHNYYLYKTEDGKFQIIPWDLSESFIGIMLDWADTPEELYEIDPFNGYDPFISNMPLVHKLLENPLYHKIYTAHLRTILEESYREEIIAPFVSDVQTLISNAVLNDPNSLWPFFTFEFNVSNPFIVPTASVAGILFTLNERKPYLESHSEISKTPPTISDVNQSFEVPQTGQEIIITAEVNNATLVELMVTNSDKVYDSDFIAINMNDDGINGDVLAGDNIFSAIIPFQNFGDVVKYYIRAQNDEALQLKPQKAEYEFYSYEVGTTSTNTFEQENMEVIISPNPFSERTHVNFPNQKDPIEQIRLVDGVGKVLRTFENELGNNFVIERKDLPVGLYYLEIWTKNRQISKKIVIQ